MARPARFTHPLAPPAWARSTAERRHPNAIRSRMPQAYRLLFRRTRPGTMHTQSSERVNNELPQATWL